MITLNKNSETLKQNIATDGKLLVFQTTKTPKEMKEDAILGLCKVLHFRKNKTYFLQNQL